MKVLVTGAAGMLGSAVVAHLRSLGWSVRAHDLAPIDPTQADEVVTGDLSDPELLRRYHPSSVLTGPLEGFATPFSTQRSRELLGFTAAYSWRSK